MFAALALTLILESQTLVACKNVETQQVSVFEGFCPAGWMFVRWL